MESSAELNPRSHYLPLERQRELTGRGARVLLLDNGIEASDILGPNFVQLSEPADRSRADHSFRIASICGGSFPADNPRGLAPEAKFYSFNHALLTPENFIKELERIEIETGPIDIICVAWSAPAALELAIHGNAIAAELAHRGTLIIAAAGHDGRGRVRMPALWQDTLAVGVHDPELNPAIYCSHSDAFGKPEIFVPDLAVEALDATGARSVMKGTSAAAAVVTGLAALSVQWLRQNNKVSNPALVKASLLAATIPMSAGGSRAVVPNRLFDRGSYVCQFANATQKNYTLRFTKQAGVAFTITALVTRLSPSKFLSPYSALDLEINCSSVTRRFSSSIGYVLGDLPDRCDGPVEVRLGVRGAECSLTVAVQGGSEKHIPVQQPIARGRLTLGISASHHASACVLEGHVVKRAIQLERITRRKADGSPFLGNEDAAHYCLGALGIQTSDIDIFAYNSQPVLPGWTGLSRPLASRQFSLFDPYGPNAIFVSHHLAHAFAAYCASPFSQAVVVVADGAGGGIVGPETDLILTGPEMRSYLSREANSLPGIHVTSTYIFNPEGFKLVDREYAPSFNPRCGSSSLGETYAAVSEYIFKNWLDGGKLMGLAPYGDRQSEESLLYRDGSGRLAFRSSWKLSHSGPTGNDPLEYKDLAARIQADFEEAIVDRSRAAIKVTGHKNLILTGGLALNSVANEQVRRDSGCKEVFFFPAANDAGISVGAAHAAVFAKTGKARVDAPASWSDFQGHPYDGRDYAVAVEEEYRALVTESLSISTLARSLAEGWIVAWFESGSEFGPRALGHRSILASPKSRDTWLSINRRIKGREDFRPFAPVVAEEDAETFFELDVVSPYMLRVVKVRRPYRATLEAVCHVDGSARVQTVNSATNPSIYRLLVALRSLYHPPVLLNTSLNVAGEPIIETPSEAIRFLLTTPIDALVLGDRLLRRRSPPQNLLSHRSVLKLGPGVRLSHVSSRRTSTFEIESELSRQRIALSKCTHRILAALDGEASLRDLGVMPEDKDSVLPTLIALWSKCLVVYHGESDG
jgi:carbamoyltransferase